MSDVQYALAVGLQPSRTDGMITLHVGDNYIQLLPEDVERLIKDLRRLLPASQIATELPPLAAFERPVPGAKGHTI